MQQTILTRLETNSEREYCIVCGDLYIVIPPMTSNAVVPNAGKKRKEVLVILALITLLAFFQCSLG
jgi:hypothetical protein